MVAVVVDDEAMRPADQESLPSALFGAARDHVWRTVLVLVLFVYVVAMFATGHAGKGATPAVTTYHSQCSRITGECFDPGADFVPAEAPVGDSRGWDN